MYAEMMRRMQQKDVEKKKIEVKKAIVQQADAEKNATVGPDLEEEERIRKRQAGTAMSVEAFEAWKKSFDKEMSDKAAAAAKLDKSITVMTEEEKEEYYAKPTGKELFLTNKAMMEGALSSIGDSGEQHTCHGYVHVCVCVLTVVLLCNAVLCCVVLCCVVLCCVQGRKLRKP
jgi:Flp pilus assembly protein TadB